MTKSNGGPNGQGPLNNNQPQPPPPPQQQQSHSIPEIPIWVSDKKKWVTGISKKTTINDIIYAILKQCNINCDYETINDYVLVEQYTDNSEIILKGHSKVTKHLQKWTENKCILKVKKCEEFNNDYVGGDLNNSNSLSKIFKKLSTNSNSSAQLVSNGSIRLVDVKLPQQSSSTPTNQSTSTLRSLSSSHNRSNDSLPYKQYDPNYQKSLVVTSILDKDKKLNAQFEKVKLLDELIKEAEKTLTINEKYYLNNGLIKSNNSNSNNENSNIDIKDIYSTFPEMFTHNLNEVNEFTDMCLRLFTLDDNLTKQKYILNALENEIQRELTLNHDYDEHTHPIIHMIPSDTPEVIKLKKEVSISREQTRVQCKELHDLDLRMRQNESQLTTKEQTLKSLLEDLYVQETFSGDTRMSSNTNESLQELKICDSTNRVCQSKVKKLSSPINTKDHYDNDSGISSMSSENSDPYRIIQKSTTANAKSVMETLV